MGDLRPIKLVGGLRPPTNATSIEPGELARRIDAAPPRRKVCKVLCKK